MSRNGKAKDGLMDMRDEAAGVRASGRSRRLRRLLTGTSGMVLGLAVAVHPAHAQMARIQAAVGNAATVAVGSTGSASVSPRSARQQAELNTQTTERAQIASMRQLVTAAKAAAVASIHVTDGLSTNGLNPAVSAIAAASSEATGLATWQGAKLPTQTVSGSNYTVTVDQTDSRAILSWNSFNVGTNTSLVFDQSAGGTSASSWIVLNRVVDPHASPTQILGSIKAQGTVLVLNRNGIIFGNGSQVNTNSLLASSLEIGSFGTDVSGNSTAATFTGLTVAQRNLRFLQNGLLADSSQPTKFTTILTSSLAGTGTYSTSNPDAAFSATPEGDVVFERGSTVTAGTGGYIIATAPNVTNDGQLLASQGQVSLQAGRIISYAVSTGGSSGLDADIRGLVLRTLTSTGGNVVNSGLIQSTEGYISLGTDLAGTVTNSGLLYATTSVSRNGMISLTGGNVVLAGAGDPLDAGGIAILEDGSAETIPQGTASDPNSFRQSRIDIGGIYISTNALGATEGLLGPANVTFGQNSLLVAPGATVSIGGTASQTYDVAAYQATGNSVLQGDVTVADGATIDVSGIKDVQLAATRNQVKISPLKGNELRDTPNYRDATTDGSFTLNGATVYIDPRVSGVRSDGVAWVGSPLIEAGSAVSQIAVGAAELMTKGGSVTFATALLQGATTSRAPQVTIAKTATIDFSGGWVHYNAGWIQTTRLIRSDGTLVDIADADPNGNYIGIAGTFEDLQSRYGIADSYTNRLLAGQHYEAAYDEGRDAGALIVRASAADIEGTLRGDAFAGAQQLLKGPVGTATSSIALDPRHLQSTQYELPSGGFLRIGAFSGTTSAGLGGDILVHADGATGLPSGQGTLLLNDSRLSGAGLSALTLQTSGKVTFDVGTEVTLANGGILTVDAGRAIRFDGTVTAHGGKIIASTYELGGTLAQSSLIALTGNAFSTADDLSGLYATVGAAPTGVFDIDVTGTLDVSGLWSNDYLLASDALPNGTAFVDGGSISLTVAPKVIAALGTSLANATQGVDLSGSITLASSALLDVSSGGYVTPTGTFDLTAKGGNVSLIDDTVYAALTRNDPQLDNGSSTDLAIGGQNQSVTYTPYYVANAQKDVRYAVSPVTMNSTVSFSASNFKGVSFGGGGTFMLVAPSIAFGGGQPVSGAWIPLDFLQQTGFGTLSLSAWNSTLYHDLFSNGIEGNSAFLTTTTFAVKAGERLDLSQVLLPDHLTAVQTASLLALGTGSDVTSVLDAAIPASAWDQKAARLQLGGLSELVVEAGGTITGAAGAAIVTPGLYNAGTIRLMGGSITQAAGLPEDYIASALGVHGTADGGNGLSDVLGGGTLVDGQIQYDETTLSKYNGLSNHDLFAKWGSDRIVYFLGKLDQGVGVDLVAGSVTDLSGGLVTNPYAPYLGTGRKQVVGTLYGGGSITLSAQLDTNATALFTSPVYGTGRYQYFKDGAQVTIARSVIGRTIAAQSGAVIDLSGATGMLDVQTGQSAWTLTEQWSEGGSLSALAGGALGGATIRAAGGTAAAQGGTLTWLRPTFAQSAGEGSVANLLSADQIMASGFSSVVALGNTGFAGNVSLTLGKSFVVTAAGPATSSPKDSDYQVTVSLTANGDASVSAPYISLGSGSQLAGASTLSGVTQGSLTFSAQGIDLVGGIGFSVPQSGDIAFDATGDVRLIGVAQPIPDLLHPTGLTGMVLSSGDIRFSAGQVYATTGTGNLQQLLEDQRNGTSVSADRPYTVASLADNGTILFTGTGTTSSTPYSAGSWLRILAAHIEQDGVLRAPLGLLEIGSSTPVTLGGVALTIPASQTVVFGPASVTSVSGEGLAIPYGTTTDLTSYYLSPNTNSALSAAPVGELKLAGVAIDVQGGATLDGRGGGDVFAFEFVSGTGGSRDILSRTNTDSFSSDNGYQYADGRQVYAIVSVSKAGTVAAYDPIYSSDYSSGTNSLYGSWAGKTVWLDAAPGVAAGEYLLLPAHYALIPGAMRLVVNTGSAVPVTGSSTTLRDGSVVVGGSFGTAGTDYRQSTRYSFTVMDQATIAAYSKIDTTSGTTTFADQASAAGKAAPRSPNDAATFVISPAKTLTVDGTFVATPGTGGKGAVFDISAAAIEITSATASPAVSTGALVLSTTTINNLNANSLLLGGVRQLNADGTTTLDVVADTITVDAGVNLTLPELILAVGGSGSSITVGQGASLVASGTLADSAAGNYVVGYSSSASSGSGYDNTGIGSILRLSTGVERSVVRTVAPSLSASGAQASTIVTGAGASLAGTTLDLFTSGNVALASDTGIAATNATLSTSAISFGAGGLDPAVAASLAATTNLTLASGAVITLGSALPAIFNNLIIEASGLATSGAPATIKAGNVTFTNTGSDAGTCSAGGSAACGAGQTLTVIADTITLGKGTFRLFGDEGGVELDAAKGLYVEGKGTLGIDDPSSAAHVALTLRTPFVADRATGNSADVTSGGADYTFSTTGLVTVDGTGLSGSPTTTAQSAGSLIRFGDSTASVAGFVLSNAAIRATSGVVNVYSTGSIVVSGNASIAVPGFSVAIGAGSDAKVATAGSGTINLRSAAGDITLGSGTSLVVDNGIGNAGTLELVASHGTIALGASLNAGIAATTARRASLDVEGAAITDAAGNAFDLSGFVGSSGHLFGGDVLIHTGTGNLVLDAGLTLAARSVTLETDAGTIAVGGTIDTSGDNVAKLAVTDAAYTAATVDGGNIALYGADGVALASGAKLLARTYGYAAADSRQASGGNVTIGINNTGGAISIADGAVIDVSAASTASRLVSVSVKDPTTLVLTTDYRQVAGDTGGDVTFRAPILSGSVVNLSNKGTITGAASLTLDAFQTFDLGAIAASGQYSGVTVAADGTVHLNAAATGAPNFLADTGTSGTIPWFIRNFSVGLSDGSSLAGYRVRPEVVLKASGSITLDSNINLAAGTITDYAAAVAAGDLVASPLGTDSSGNPLYQVVSGREADLLANYVDMTFRVGGKATGEAGIFTFSAGGDLNVANSISDGFFVFADRTSAQYINYQLGGGNRLYQPGVVLNCASGGGCDNTLASYRQNATQILSNDQVVTINLASGKLATATTPTFVYAPYSASANSVAANGTGDAIDEAELFPLIAVQGSGGQGSGSQAVRSSDIRLVAGALANAADPTAVDHGKVGSVIVSGEKYYTLTATKGTTGIAGALQLGFADNSGTVQYADAGQFLSGTFASYVDSSTSNDLYTKLLWGSSSTISSATLQAALTYFAGHTFIRQNGQVVGVVASLGEVTQFLSGSYASTWSSLMKSTLGTNLGNPVSYSQNRVYYRPLVRTGDGSISVAASGDINIAGASTITYRTSNGSTGSAGTTYSAQVGGSAIYTAGTRLADMVSATPAFAQTLAYVPSPQGLLDIASVAAGNGGDVTLVADRDVLGRRDIWSELYKSSATSISTTLPGYSSGTATFDPATVGTGSQIWRVGTVGQDTEITIVPQLFTSGVGALAGGNVTVAAGRDVSDLTVALDNSATTTTLAGGAKVLVTSAAGNLTLTAGRDLAGGQIDIAEGVGTIDVGRSVTAAGVTTATGSYDAAISGGDTRNLLRIRVSDATVSLRARGSVDIGGIGALGAEDAGASAQDHLNSTGFFSALAGVSVATDGALTLVDNRPEMRVSFFDAASGSSAGLSGYVLPPSLSLTSLGSDILLGNGKPNEMFASPYGNLTLVAGGSLGDFALSMSDANPSDLPGLFSVATVQANAGELLLISGLGFGFDATVGTESDSLLRQYHDQTILHAGDPNPVEIYAGGSIRGVQLNLPKAAIVNAGQDIVNLYFQGQNVAATDVTQIVAGRDITATTDLPALDTAVAGKPYVNVTSFELGGPGALMIEAGRNLGPFLNSVTVGNVSYAGGIRTIGNLANPWLGNTGADIYTLFGVSNGIDWSGFLNTYVDPANAAMLDGDLFVQNVDSAGNLTPDRSKPVYAAKLAVWLRDNAPDVFAKVFPDGAGLSDSALASLAYGRYAQEYQAFVDDVPALNQREFLMKVVYFGELAATADPTSPSYQHYIRGYRAIQSLFPATLGYTDNLSTFTTDPATVTADHPLGVATKKLVDGKAAVATTVQTGNADLRLSTIQTARGGSIDILGPGGSFTAGSVVRTSTQAATKSTPFTNAGIYNIVNGAAGSIIPGAISTIPLGYEGILTLRGGSIQSFTDEDFRLNQSRLFTLQGGDITMWSSNGDLNAGQGPKTSSNFPPVTLRFDTDGYSEVDSVGSVSGAGIAALQTSTSQQSSSIVLVAPVGTVDAGDAGVRATGDVYVAAARVANSDNFKVGGVSVGVPTTAAVAAPAIPASATSAVAATAAQAGQQQRSDQSDRRSIIRVDVLGFIGNDQDSCPTGKFDAQGNCLN